MVKKNVDKNILKKKLTTKNFEKKVGKKLKKNVRTRNVAITTKSRENHFNFFVLVLLPKIKLWTRVVSLHYSFY